MSILTNILSAEIKDLQNEFDAKTLTRPTLTYSDGNVMSYCVDLDVGQKDPLRGVPIASNSKDALYADVGSAVRVRRSASGWFEVTGLSKRMPGTMIEVPVTVPKFIFAPMKRYVQPTAPGSVGQTVVGVPPLSTGGVVVGDPISVGISSRIVTYGEMAEFGGYGVLPYGAIATYSGNTLVSITY